MSDRLFKEAEDFLADVPARDPESIHERIQAGKKLASDLDFFIRGPKTALGDNSYMQADELKTAVENDMFVQRSLLQSVLSELPTEEYSDSPIAEAALDIPASSDALALQVALETVAMVPMDRRREGMERFDETIAPFLPEPSSFNDPEMSEFPRRMYAQRLEELIAQPPQKLAELAERVAVKGKGELGEWMYGEKGRDSSGKDTEPNPSSKNESSNPEEYPKGDESIDTFFDDELNKERGRRGLPKSASVNGKPKVSYIRISSPPPELLDHGIEPDSVKDVVQDVADITDEGGEVTYWIEHEDKLLGFDEEDVEPLMIVPEQKVEEADTPGEIADGTGGPDSSGNSDGPDDKPDFLKEKKDDAPSSSSDDGNDSPLDGDDNDNDDSSKDKRESKVAVEDKSGIQPPKDSANVPEAKEDYNDWLHRAIEKNQPTPVGPDRRRSKDVPATNRGNLSPIPKKSMRKIHAGLNRIGFEIDPYDVPDIVQAMVDGELVNQFNVNSVEAKRVQDVIAPVLREDYENSKRTASTQEVYQTVRENLSKAGFEIDPEDVPGIVEAVLR